MELLTPAVGLIFWQVVIFLLLVFLLGKFADKSVDPLVFSHEAHLRLAWIHINKYGVSKAIDNITRQIKAFAAHHGDHKKYNETITVASVKVVNHFIMKSKSTTFNGLISEFPRLKDQFMGLFNSHYSAELFRSVEAKINYIDPDLLPFDS